jgi:hypothetical protein
MVRNRKSGNCMTMFQSGSKYYLWNPIEGDIWGIVTSMDLVDIVTQIAKRGLKSRTLRRFRLILGLEND